MSRLTLLTLLTLLTTIVACTCPGGSYKRLFKRADTVLKAEVIKASTKPMAKPSACDKPPCASEFQLAIFTLQLLQIYKGCGPKKAVFKAVSMTGPGFCGTYLKPGVKYVLLLGEEKRQKGIRAFSVDSCQGNAAFDELSVKKLMFLGDEAAKAENHCIP